jgi:hypothetical protein
MNHTYLLPLSRLLNRKRTTRGWSIISDFIPPFVSTYEEEKITGMFPGRS